MLTCVELNARHTTLLTSVGTATLKVYVRNGVIWKDKQHTYHLQVYALRVLLNLPHILIQCML